MTTTKGSVAPIDSAALTELKLYIDNNAESYRQQTLPCIKNAARRISGGTYNLPLAPKLWLYLVCALEVLGNKIYSSMAQRDELVQIARIASFANSIRENASGLGVE